MKIVLGVGTSDFVAKGAEATRQDVNSTATIYAFQLSREFRKRGIEVDYYTLRTTTREETSVAPDEEEISGYYLDYPPPVGDHFISLEQCGFIWRHPSVLEAAQEGLPRKSHYDLRPRPHHW